MTDFEKLGVFYLGREYDLKAGAARDELLLYESRDLATHAVCVGMTGSGKTGLCLTLIEEAAIDSIPSIVIDPKGDLAALMLTFPALRAEDFAPWVQADDAARQGLSPADFAAKQAAAWAAGLSAWGQDGARIQRLRDAADVRIYTPGSTAGLPLSILKSLAAPAAGQADPELQRERISTLVSSLLGLLNIPADPLQSREHIFLSTIVNSAWSAGRDLDLAALIIQIQTPPFNKIGVLDLETFYPAKERFGLVMALNNLLAAPGFEVWLTGEPLDIQNLLYGPSGKPRVAILSIAHLSDAERMFFVSLLLNQLLGWMRTQTGTASLRALLYMDEIFGYFPPVQNPPSKPPLLTLLKQARAFGLGLVLATQNPGDLDYKGLSNAGTWFIGRLQTDRDRQKVLEGLEGASAAGRFDRAGLEAALAGLGSRVFLMNNTHEDKPVIFQSRWTLSYMRGPLTRPQIKTLMDPIKTPVFAPVNAAVVPPASAPALAPLAAPDASGAGNMPAVDPGVPQVFLPERGRPAPGRKLIYKPFLLGAARVNFVDARSRVDYAVNVAQLTPVTDAAVPVDWANAREAGVDPADLVKAPSPDAAFLDLPGAAGKARNYERWSRDYASWLYGSQALSLLRSQTTRQISAVGESERDFRLRLAQAGREGRDAETDKLRQKYAPKIAALQERLRRAQQAVDLQKEQAQQQKMQTAISFGATMLGAFVGRKGSTVSRVTTAARGVSRTMKEQTDIGRAEDTVEAIQAQLQALDEEFKARSAELSTALDAQAETLETLTIKPKKTGISVQLLALAWAPYWRDPAGGLSEAWTQLRLIVNRG
jgi:hypothetical protein